MKSIWKIILVVGILLVAGVVLLLIRGGEDNWIKDSEGDWVRHGNPADIPNQVLEDIDSFDRCSKAGFPILETYPEQCKLPNGKSFTKKI